MEASLSTQINLAAKKGKDEKRMSENTYIEFPCDVCNSNDAVEVPHSREYQNDEPVHICRNCGFVFVKNRRSAERIGQAWSDEIFGEVYTAQIPAVRARLLYVTDYIDTYIKLKGKSVCDIGGGEGVLLDIMASTQYDVGSRCAIEPSPKNCETLTKMGIDCFHGTIEDYEANDQMQFQTEIVTITWTLENCQQCRKMLDVAWGILKPGGYLCIATGSRILVPFKKPLHFYLSKNPADTNSFRFSANTTRAIMAVSHFQPEFINRYIDSDILCVIGRKVSKDTEVQWTGDNYLEVYNFFERWHAETKLYYSPEPN